MPAAISEPRYGVLVPVKPPAFAKSRLAGLGDRVRRQLAAAFATDTVSAALQSPSVACVLAVTDDHVVAAALADLGAEVVPDGVADDLNGTLVQAAVELRRRRPGLRLAALCADLPALDPAELTTVLTQTPTDRASFVADRHAAGTTLLLAPDVDSFAPRFGPGSRRAHLAAGMHEIDRSDIPTLRHDVDDPADLAAALALGVGARTALVATSVASSL
jgi:2-phospho-L-lactate/phosphoenolpyruvate guanylyltransferase